MTMQNIFLAILFVLVLIMEPFAHGQTFNERFSIQGYLKSGTTPLNDGLGYPMQITVKRNATAVWCQTISSNVPVVSGVFSVILSGNSNCQSLSNTFSSSVFSHSSSSDVFTFDVLVDVSKDGFGGADDATFAGIDLLPAPMALRASHAEYADSFSGTVAVANGGTGATSASTARTNLGLGSVAVINTSGVATDVLLGNGAFGTVPTPANFSGSLIGDVTGTQSATVVGKIQGYTVASTLPTNGQILTWSNANTRWEPATPAAAPVTSVAGKTGAVNIASIDITDATANNTASKLVLRDASGNFAANSATLSSVTSIANLTLSGAAGSNTLLGDNTSSSTTSLRSGTGGLSMAVTGTTGNVIVTPGSTSGTITIGNGSTGATLLGNTGSAANTTIQSPAINIGATGTATTTVVGTTTGASSTTVQAGTGKVKIGSAGVAFTGMGACTIAATAITTTATNYTCTGVPASASVAVHCSAAAAFTTPNTTSLYCRATGTVNQVACNTTVANSVSTTYICMWMQP